ncbi:hypothetical protein [Asaia sp. VD9]|uniref:hypothetical protein n=1 Tax=Asaia sp. VD9 TaxID=3081235 RepID=UPI00301AF2DD
MSLRKAGLTGFFLWSMASSPALAETAAHLKHALASQHSATRVLQVYCARIAPGVPVTAIAQPDQNDRTPPALLGATFHLGAHETLLARHVSLQCGTLVLSDAWNWYVPERLTPEMNHQLQTTDIPFGRVVAPLHFTRVPLSSVSEGLPPGILLRNTAMLTRQSDQMPFSLVEENYLIAGFARFKDTSD